MHQPRVPWPSPERVYVADRPGVAHTPRRSIFLSTWGRNMKRREFVVSSALGSVALGSGRLSFGGLIPGVAESNSEPRTRVATRKILIAGGGYGEAFIRYMATLTGKPRPRLCYLPTASADRP